MILTECFQKESRFEYQDLQIYHEAVLDSLLKLAAVSVVAGKSKDQVHGAVETETKNDNVAKPHICCRKEFELKTKSPSSDIQSGIDKESWDRVGHNYQKKKFIAEICNEILALEKISF